MGSNQSTESIVKEIKRRTRKKYSNKERIWLVLEGLQVELSISGLFRKVGLNPNKIYYEWSDEFLEAGFEKITRFYNSFVHGGWVV
ncbi:MAG: hypothetical protein KF816_03050 [Melioribacteraceae bacterium]|nr:hypothetical protein [Melioribacteraceae bacterium]